MKKRKYEHLPLKISKDYGPQKRGHSRYKKATLLQVIKRNSFSA